MNRITLLNNKEKDYVLTENDLLRVIDIVNDKADLMLTVTQGGSGFYPVYNVIQGNYLYVGNDNPNIKKIASFSDKQLPEGWDFDKLSYTFKSESNIEKIEFFKQEIPRKKDSYYY